MTPTLRDTSAVESITPAMMYFLMTGKSPTMYLAGWATLEWALMAAQDDPEILRQRLWMPAVAAAIEADAERYGFVAFGTSGRRPTRAAVKSWVADFVAANGGGRPPSSPAP